MSSRCARAASRCRSSAGDGYDTPQLLELAGPSARNVFFTTHEGIYGDQSDAAKKFNESYTTEYGKGPDSIFAALGYDGINLLADAITRANDTAGDKIRDALAATQGFKAATGEISYIEDSQIPVEVGCDRRHQGWQVRVGQDDGSDGRA